MQAFNQFYNLAGNNFGLLNSAIVALIPKKDGANGINDYRPISLIHSIAKLVSKVLSIRLAPIVQRIISPAQTAFFENKMLTRQLRLHPKLRQSSAPEKDAGCSSQVRHLQGLR